MKPLLEAKGVTRVFSSGLIRKSYTVAVDNVSISVGGDEPTVIAIAGESGSGKTTLARLLLNMLHPTKGDVRYGGRDLRSLTRSERKNFRREVQAIFQDPFEVYNPFYKVDAVLQVPAKKFGLGNSKIQRQQLIEDALEMAGLRPEETLGRYPHQLSGGQRQRVMVARAMLIRPRVILADEPVSMVDASLRATILDSLLKLNKDLGISLIYITHDLTTAFQVCDNIMILYQGSVAEAGNVEKVIKDPQHPYTQLLVRSIPRPNPQLRWGDPEIRNRADGFLNKGCKFAPRCPAVMSHCRETVPPLYRNNSDHAAACYLQDKNDIIADDDLAQMLLTKPATDRAGTGA